MVTRKFSIFCASVFVACLAGCGTGGSSAGTSDAQIQGIWNGALRSNSSGATASLMNEYFQSGTSVTGTSVIISSSGQIVIGTVNASVSGNSVSSTVNYGTFGTSTAPLTVVAGPALNGTYSKTAGTTPADTGTLSFTRYAGVSTVPVLGTYKGSAVGNAAGSTPTSITAVISSMNSADTFNASITAGGNTTVSPGAVISNNIYIIVTTSSAATIYLNGKLNGSVYSGTYLQVPASGSSSSGTFTLTKQ